VAAERADAGRRPVTATVVGELMKLTDGGGYPTGALLQVTYPFQGMTHHGTLPASIGQPTGIRISVWADQDGGLVGRPHSRRETVMQTALAALGGVFALTTLVLAWRGFVGAWVIRSRSAEWDVEWLQWDTRSRPPG
jgi:hypothetical protein